ncbi:beta-1,3-galactosyltransferase 1 [Octopus bimaculoides]|nr:beta-1,3-galactosyltransferase 1 [Octopus bimaculoides]XP_014769122.1 beta-1,3-galactosyltransferase 1 [Octopus bimaculoides]XP_014769123.1 beta-1,3-galactosyltransferase 1 [Octopus bimaculoides]XP_052825457.1 beta-1,3-galactosyltransferase 1 [Octopus bimaculoides]|eukprot:XP_014769121.1 PREDICTED: beta-1,3-galactosyltransferase 1-like [Octopus bimaculoides]
MKYLQVSHLGTFVCSPGIILRRAMALCSVSGIFGSILLLSLSFSFPDELSEHPLHSFDNNVRRKSTGNSHLGGLHSVRKFTRVAMSSNDYDARANHFQQQHSNETNSTVFQRSRLKTGVSQQSINLLEKDEVNVTTEVGIVPKHFQQYNSAFLVVIVCSHPERLEYRQAIRETWGSSRGQEFHVLFLTGKHEDPYWNALMDKENALHGDILQVDVIDSYRNLSLKVIGGLCWITDSFQSIDYVMKTDDDVYINVWYLLKLLREKVISQRQILGALSIMSPVKRDLRDPWGVRFSEFAPKTYPPYVSGGAYVMSQKAGKKLCVEKWKRQSPFIHLEDVYVTGILAQATGISHVAHPGFSFWTSKKAKAADIANNKRVSSVNMTPDQIYKLHRQSNALLVSTTSSVNSKKVER